MKRVALLIIASLMSAGASAFEAACRIEIRDVTADTEYIVTHEIEEMSDVAPDRMSFKLPGSDIQCVSAFFNLDTGTTLSCQLGPPGEDMVGSDRSMIEEKNPKNYLSFRHGSEFFVIKTSCAAAAES